MLFLVSVVISHLFIFILNICTFSTVSLHSVGSHLLIVLQSVRLFLSTAFYFLTAFVSINALHFPISYFCFSLSNLWISDEFVCFHASFLKNWHKAVRCVWISGSVFSRKPCSQALTCSISITFGFRNCAGGFTSALWSKFRKRESVFSGCSFCYQRLGPRLHAQEILCFPTTWEAFPCDAPVERSPLPAGSLERPPSRAPSWPSSEASNAVAFCAGSASD